MPIIGAEHTIIFRARPLLNSKEVYPFSAAVVFAEELVATAQLVAVQFGRCEACAELVEKAKGPVCGYGLSSKGESLDAEGARTRVHAPN